MHQFLPGMDWGILMYACASISAFSKFMRLNGAESRIKYPAFIRNFRLKFYFLNLRNKNLKKAVMEMILVMDVMLLI